MRALTWRHPFAELMFYGKIETRTRQTSYRGPVLICAGKSLFTKQEFINICGNQYERVNGIFQAHKNEILESRGYAIGVADLVDCREMTKEDEQKCFVQYEENRYCWIFDKPKMIEPFEFKGALGWTLLTEEFINTKIKYIK